MTRPPLRSHDEIQRAHDVIVGLILTPQVREQIVDEDKAFHLEICANVLCWVLHHDHNVNFATNLRDVECLLRDLGIDVEEHNGTHSER
jgi:hypothetical protein